MVNRKSIEEAVDVDGYGHDLYGNLSYRPTLSDADCVNINTSQSTLTNNSFLPSMSLSDTDFYKKQKRVALRNCGVINPEKIDEYIAMDGYFALAKVLTEMSREDVVQTLLDSGLRGRGGAGFPTGLKWKFAMGSEGKNTFAVMRTKGTRVRSWTVPCWKGTPMLCWKLWQLQVMQSVQIRVIFTCVQNIPSR